MAVYVDTMRARLGRMRMCHMTADTHEELEQLARAIGAQPGWLQHAGTPKEHYDLPLSRKARALKLGALLITQRQTVRLIQQKRALLSQPSSPPCA